ncbi:MAG TPA: TIGR03790 family protein [Kiritimatiellia bacterium]|nr:TIGR03790 family protein [Kiritimatiellia bacterium]HRZ12556.1 TIGR03790 family protein [Kiritimatiellia bacterium]HSA17634.1 TIGR03790 family protein [Kiritimatiellia bacterium]
MKRFGRIRRGLALLLALLPAVARSGGGPQNVLIVVNDGDPDSQELGRYYREARGIPERNVCHLNLSAPLHNTFLDIFEKSIRDPILAHIRDEKLSDQIDFLALCMDTPTRINDSESITAALFYGFKNAPPAPPCQLSPSTLSFYFNAERAFTHDLAGRENPHYLAMMLTGPAPRDARALVDRGAACDGTAPTGTFYLVKPPGDPDRNIRYRLFDELDFHARFMPGFPRRVFSEENTLTGLTDILGYLTGGPNHPETFWTANQYLPGAIADQLTSFSGLLPVPPMGQGSMLQWIGAGATASYGTVSEPCNFLEKFPSPMVLFWYARGFNLAESYWMGVAHPYQGLFVGDPLAAPYARPPRVTVAAPAAGQTVSGTVTVRVSAAGTPECPCAALDFYLDDLRVGTVTNIRPQAWNEVYLEFDGQEYSYILGESDDLPAAVRGLAREARKNPMLNAVPFGDRLMLMDGRIGKRGSTTPYGARVEQGLGPPPGFGARNLTPALLDGTYAARKYVMLQGAAAAGDAVECRVTLGNGLIATARVEAAEGEAALDVAKRLKAALDSHPVLAGPDGIRIADLKAKADRADFALESRTAGPPGVAILLRYAILPKTPGAGLAPPVAYEGRLSDNMDLMSSRGMLLFHCGRETLAAEFPWDTSGIPDGPHVLRLVARDGTAVQTQGHAFVPVVVRNTDRRCRLTGVESGQVVRAGARLSLGVECEPADFPVGAVDFLVEGKIADRAGKAPFHGTVDTAPYRGGRVSVQVRVADADGRQTLSDPVWISVPR